MRLESKHFYFHVFHCQSIEKINNPVSSEVLIQDFFHFFWLEVNDIVGNIL